MLNHTLKLNKYRASFILQSTQAIPELQLVLKQYQYNNAKLIHLDTKDSNKVFVSLFRSQPDSSKGTPHILEHLMCCGSEKYPVRDPFMAMIKRSLNTYFNAWTGPDFICFPFASTNQKDFDNLLDVTLDMVFKPTLRELDFRQEGYRLAYQDNKLTYKGVVYNEMKGAMQNGDSVFQQYIQSYMLNNTIYQFNSGGEPKDIVNLQYEELRQHYLRTFTNDAVFYQYGGTPNFELLKHYLDTASTPEVRNIGIPSIKEPPKILNLPPTDGDKQSYLTFSYLLKNGSVVDGLALQLISHVLFDQQCGLLYPILEEGLAESFGKGHGPEQFGNHTLFNISFQGVAEDRKTVDVIAKKVYQVLKQLSEAFPQEHVDAALHQLETQFKMPSAEQGIRIFQQLVNPLLQGQDILQYLQLDNQIKELKQLVSSGQLEQIVKNQLINHVTLYGQPDDAYLTNLVNDESNQLNRIEQDLNEQQVQQINLLNDQLDNREESDFSVLPTVTIKDIEQQHQHTQFEITTHQGVKIHETIQNTNGITFFKLKFNLGHISDTTKQYLDMFSNFINKFGTEEYTYQELSQLFSQYTQGLEVTYDCVDGVGTYMVFSISCLNDNIAKTLELLADLMTNAKYKEHKNVSTLLRNNKIQIQNQIIDDSLQYAQSLANSIICYPYKMTDINQSAKFQLQYAKHYLAADGMKKGFYLDDFEFQMDSFMQMLINQHRMEVIVHQDGNAKYTSQLNSFIDALKQKYRAFSMDPFQEELDEFTPQFNSQAMLIPSQINCNSRAYIIPNFGNVDLPPLVVMADILSHNTLHRELREKGGAYGSGCKVRAFKGVLNLWTYQDPNILESFNVFDNMKLDADETKLNEAKLTVFQRMDLPVEPYHRGVEQLTLGLDDEQINNYRKSLLAVSVNDVNRVFDKYLKQSYSQATFASQEHKDISKLEGWQVSKFNFD